MTFGEKLTKLMRLREISAIQLSADIITTVDMVAKWQQGTDMPYLDQIQKLYERFWCFGNTSSMMKLTEQL